MDFPNIFLFCIFFVYFSHILIYNQGVTMGWINNEGSMASFAKGGKVKTDRELSHEETRRRMRKRTKSRKQRKKEVMEANLSPRDKFKGTDKEFIKSRKKK